MLKSYFYIFILNAFSFSFLNAMESEEARKPNAAVYSLPKEVDRESLIKSSVMVECGQSGGTGVAIGDRWILTSAHGLVGYALERLAISCIGIVNERQQYNVPRTFAYSMGQDEDYYRADFGHCKDLKVIPIADVHFHPATAMKEYKVPIQELTLLELMIKLNDILSDEAKCAEKYASSGVHSTYFDIVSKSFVDYITYGPDVAILECVEPHGLPCLSISDETTEARSLVHILGLAGMRYSKEDKKYPVAGSGCINPAKLEAVYQPKIYGQRFKCVPAYAEGLKVWINRPFLRKDKKDQFIMEDAVYPNAPDGFGLIAEGDSGAGCIVVREGKPSLVGIVSAGEIDNTFITTQRFLANFNFDEKNIDPSNDNGVSTLLQMYKNCAATNDRNLRWFVTQTLTDVTKLKPWIESVMKRD